MVGCAETPRAYICRTALVVGGASGIGRASALALADAGARVFVADLDLDRAMDVAQAIVRSGGQAEALPVDVADSVRVHDLFQMLRERCGGLDLSVHCFGVLGRTTALEECSDEDWERAIAVNLSGTFYCCREAVRWMKTCSGGRIVNFSSVAALMPTPGAAAYSAAKGGVVQLTRTLAREAAQHNIRVNVIAPGYVQTPMLEEIDSGFRERILRRTPLGRFAAPEEISALVRFLASAEADYFTGQVLSPNGGLVI
jgi:NAD(P)-dependent dehydrogenase (short-subunit alcohol dehydrogenase family)